MEIPASVFFWVSSVPLNFNTSDWPLRVKKGVELALFDRVQARADQGLVDACLPDLDLVANLQEANGLRAG